MNVTPLPWTLQFDPDAGHVYGIAEAHAEFVRLVAAGNAAEARESVRAHAVYITKATDLYPYLVAAVRAAKLALASGTAAGQTAIEQCRKVLEEVDSDAASDCPMCGFRITEIFCELGGRRFHPSCYMEFGAIQEQWAAEQERRDELENELENAKLENASCQSQSR
mgnify:CR=1 FL=1